VSPGVSRLEQELGEKWFQRLGIIVLVIAFIFLLAIVLPGLTPAQIIAMDLAAAAALAVLAEYLYRSRDLHDYAKGLQLGALPLAHLGVWGGGFLFDLPGLPWPLLLAALFPLQAVAALRYRSPLLSVEFGGLYAVWAVGLRVAGILSPWDYALILALGAAGGLALIYALADELSALSLTFLFNGLAIATAPLLAPYGHIPIVGVGLATAAVVTLLRAERVVPVRPELRVVAWSVGIVLTYGVLIANLRSVDDLTILILFVTLTAAFGVSELLARDRRFSLAFAAVVGLMALPVPLLMGRGEVALLVYPALLLALAFLRPGKGYVWLVNLVYFSLIAYASVRAADPVTQYWAVWAGLFATMALHAFLQWRSGYGPRAEELPLDVHVPLYVLTLAGLGARVIQHDATLVAYAAALGGAVLLNRKALAGGPPKLTALIVVLGGSMIVARWYALFPLLANGPHNAPLLALYHIGLAMALGAWVAHRRSALQAVELVPGSAYTFSPPAAALLLPLGAQDPSMAPAFIAVPAAVVVLAYYLDDALTFNLSYLLGAGQASFALALHIAEAPRAALLGLGLSGALVALGFLHDLWGRRRQLARSSQWVGTSSWMVFTLVAFGGRVETTISWALVGGTAMAWGLWRRFPNLRYLGFGTFFIVLSKVFLYDIADLPDAVRIFGLIVVAASLLVISYGYARYRRRQATGG
jgi:hypothetical protein